MVNLKLPKEAIKYLTERDNETHAALIEEAKKLYFLRTKVIPQDRELMITAMVTEEARGVAKEYLEAEENDFEDYEMEELKQLIQQIVVIRNLHKEVIQKAIEHEDLEVWEPTGFFTLLDSAMKGFHESSLKMQQLEDALSKSIH